MFRCNKAIPIICMIMSLQSVVTGDDNLKKRFLKEAPKGWERQKKLREHVQFVVREKQAASIDGQAIESANTEIVYKTRMDGALYSIERYSYKSDSPLRAAFVNGVGYAFELKRSRRTSPLIVTRLGTDEQMRESLRRMTYAFRAKGTPYEMWGQDLDLLVKSAQFRITGIEEVQENNLEIVRVRFECHDKNLVSQYSHARLDLLPKFDWAVKSAEYNATDQLKIKIDNEYKFIDGAGIRPLSYTYSKFVPIEKYISQNRFEYEDFVFKPSSDSYYTLSNYMLPEPGEIGKVLKGSGLQFWLIGIAIAMFCLAFSLNRAARRAA